MSFVELMLIGLGLAMDAFAVAVCKGLNMKKINKKHAVLIALTFGFFQGFMPFLGYLLGTSFEQYITSIDHWLNCKHCVFCNHWTIRFFSVIQN